MTKVRGMTFQPFRYINSSFNVKSIPCHLIWCIGAEAGLNHKCLGCCYVNNGAGLEAFADGFRRDLEVDRS